MTVNERPMGGAAPSLERDAIGPPEVLFQSITHMAPAVATALSIGAATSFAGGITPLAVLFAMIAVLFTAFSMAELARHPPSAGGMFTYVCHGLGSFFGWLVAWGFALAEPLVCRGDVDRPSTRVRRGSIRAQVVGWPTGLEPVTFGATIRCSAIELRPPQCPGQRAFETPSEATGRRGV